MTVKPYEISKFSFLSTLASFVLVVGSLYWARAVLIPLALAFLLTFLLQPAVAALHRRGLSHTPAVVLVVVLVSLVLSIIGWVVVTQFASLAYELPRYTDNLKHKINDMRSASSSGVFGKIQETIADLTREFEKHRQPSANGQETVAVKTEGPSLVSYVPSLLEFLGEGGVVFVLLLFMLIAYGDWRDRLFRLIGYGHLTLTTKALDEASQRISRYLLMQFIINGTYGCAVSLGLFCFGVPYALLWGFLGTAFRFIPYVGPALAALLPIALSLAVFPDWAEPLLVVGFFVILELVTNMILEPLLYGRSARVSEVALMVAIMFWTWLWGPVGLLLATPLTVCLGVLGKYVPQLTFLDVLLSDEPATELNRYYQRLVARDQDGAAEVAEELLQTQTLIDVYDSVLVPALFYAEQDQQRDNLTPEEARWMYQTTWALVDNLDASQAQQPPAEAAITHEEGTAAVLPAKISLLGCPAHDEADEIALQMLQQVLDPLRFEVHLARPTLLTGEVISMVEAITPAVVCIGLVPPGGFTQTRYLYKRLRARFPTLPIVVGCWGAPQDEAEHLARLRLGGIEHMGTTLLETRTQLMQMQLPQTPPPSVCHTPSHVA